MSCQFADRPSRRIGRLTPLAAVLVVLGAVACERTTSEPPPAGGPTAVPATSAADAATAWLDSTPAFRMETTATSATSATSAMVVPSAPADLATSPAAPPAAAAAATVSLEERFPSPLGAWRTRFVAQHSNLRNFYVQYGKCPTGALNEDCRGNNLDGIWLADDNNADKNSYVRFDSAFARTLGGFSIDVGSQTASARIRIYDAQMRVLLDQAVPPGCSSCLYSGRPNVYATFAVQSAAGIGGFDLTGDVEGSVGVDNIVVTQLSPNRAPTVAAGGPYAGAEGAPIAFAAAGSDPDGDAVAYAWDLDDDGTFEKPGQSATGAFADEGSYTVTVRATDGNGGQADATAQVAVANVAPSVASTSAPAETHVDGVHRVTLAGLAFTDPGVRDGPWRFGVDWGDGAAATTGSSVANRAQSPGATLPALSHDYARAGTYTIRVTVTDADDAAGSVTLSYEARNGGPTADPGRNTDAANADRYAGAEGQPVAFDGSASSDPDGDPLAYEWSFGDGTTATGARPSHAYADNRVYTASLTVRDADGAAATTSFTVDVRNVNPTASGVTVPQSAVREGDQFTLGLTGGADVAADLPGLTYAFDCGTGRFGALTSSSATTCTAADDGSLPVRAKIVDKDGGETVYPTAGPAHVAVTNVAPTATFVVPAAAVGEGSAFALSLASPTDPGAADRAAGFTYAFDCGAGYGAYGSAASASCPTTDDETRATRARIRDKDGAETEYTGTVTVANVSPTGVFAATPGASVIVGNGVALAFSDVTDPGTADVARGIAQAFACNDGGFAATPACTASAAGTLVVAGRLTDKDGGTTSYARRIQVDRATTTVTVAGGAGQYSDRVTLQASLGTNAGPGAGSPTGTMEFYVDGVAVGAAPVTGTGVVAAVVTITRPAGGHALTARFTSTHPNYASSAPSAAATLAVTAERATLAYASGNPTAIKVAVDGGASPAFTLRVTVAEAQADVAAPDGAGASAAAGDVGRAAVTMTLTPLAGGGGAIAATACTGDAAAGGYAARTYSCDFAAGVPVSGYAVQVRLGAAPAAAGVDAGTYYAAAPLEEVLTVYDPSLGFATGGGAFAWPGTGERTTFAFTVKYQKNGTTPAGNLVVVRHLADGSAYRLESSSIDVLALSPAGNATGYASFSGKGTFGGPGIADGGAGDQSWTVYVEDNDEPGVGTDVFWIAVSGRPALTLASPARESARPLAGGSVSVPHGAR